MVEFNLDPRVGTPFYRQIIDQVKSAMAAGLLLGLAPAGQAQSGGPSVPLYDNLGEYHRSIDTGVELAQSYFDQGLRLQYAFNHAEAIRSYREAVRLDPECAMCWWGIALAHGPNINALMDSAAA